MGNNSKSKVQNMCCQHKKCAILRIENEKLKRGEGV